MYFKDIFTPDFDTYLWDLERLGTVKEGSITMPEAGVTERICTYSLGVSFLTWLIYLCKTEIGNNDPDFSYLSHQQKKTGDFTVACSNEFLGTWKHYVPFYKTVTQLKSTPTAANPEAFTQTTTIFMRTQFGWNEGGLLFTGLGYFVDWSVDSQFYSSFCSTLTGMPGIYMEYLYVKRAERERKSFV
jgi:hypothetical protein